MCVYIYIYIYIYIYTHTHTHICISHTCKQSYIQTLYTSIHTHKHTHLNNTHNNTTTQARGASAANAGERKGGTGEVITETYTHTYASE